MYSSNCTRFAYVNGNACTVPHWQVLFEKFLDNFAFLFKTLRKVLYSVEEERKEKCYIV